MFQIDELRWTEWAEDHILARHQVILDEVEEAVANRTYGRREGKFYLVFGKTDAGRHLKIVLGREDEGVWRVVTAMDATITEQRRAKPKSRKGAR